MANNENEFFWDNDMTTVHDRRSWFGQLSMERRIIYLLLLLFVISWSFLLGFAVMGATQPERDELYIATDYNTSDEEIPATLDLEGMRVIMLIGADTRGDEETGRSDTIMLAFLNMDDKSVKLLSVPRDSYIQIPSSGWKTKVNAAYSSGGVSVTKETLERLLGITIDNYMTIDFQSFADVVDALGGLEVDVDQRMYKPSEGIDLQPGLQTLDGAGALAYCRYRDYPDGDLGRIAHQQNFIKLMVEKLFSASTVAKVPELVKIVFKYVNTDLKLTDAIEMATYARQMDMDNLTTYTVPGEGKWLPEGEGWYSFQIILASQLQTIMTEILGPDVPFTLHVIDDGGTGRYSLPSDVEEPDEHAHEEELTPPEYDPNLPLNPDTPVEPDPNADPEGEGGIDNGGGEDSGEGGIDDNTDVWDLPEP